MKILEKLKSLPGKMQAWISTASVTALEVGKPGRKSKNGNSGKSAVIFSLGVILTYLATNTSDFSNANSFKSSISVLR